MSVEIGHLLRYIFFTQSNGSAVFVFYNIEGEKMFNAFRTIFHSAILVRVFVFAFAATILAACSTTEPMKPDRAASLKRIGVIALLPDELAYEKMGITVFNNERKVRPVGDSFNEAARKGAERALKKTGREIVFLQVDAPRLAQKLRSGSFYFDSPAEYIEEELQVLVKQNQLDAVVFVSQTFDSENGLNGVRMFFRAGLGTIDSALLMPSVGVVPVDSRIKRLAYGCCRSPRIPVKRPDEKAWEYELESNLDPATHAYIAREMGNAIESYVENTIRSMGF